MVLTLTLTSDRATAENVILEIRALAQKFGLDIADVAVIRKPAVVPKKAIPPSGPVHDAEDTGPESV